MKINETETLLSNKVNQEPKEDYITNCINSYSSFLKSSKELKSCPHCSSTNVVKYGSLVCAGNKYKRCRCKDCKRTFSEVTGSTLSYSKKNITKWIMYIGCMAKSMTLKSISSELKINIKTAFAWRHKILSSIESNVMAQELCHHVQIHEVVMRRNLKGNKRKPLENKKVRIANMQFNIPNDERIKIISCIDDSENIILRGFDVITLTFKDVKKVLLPLIKPNSILCTVRNMAYTSFARQNNLEIEMIKSSKHRTKTGEYLNTREAITNGMNFISYVGKFRGIATKYVNYYLNLYVWEIKNKTNKFSSAVNNLFIDLLNSRKVLRVVDFRNVKLDGLLA